MATSDGGLIIAPGGFPASKVRETLTSEEVKRVQEFEEWCSRRGLVLDLFCRECVDNGLGPDARVWGDNKRDATSYHITCRHADRVFGDESTRL